MIYGWKAKDLGQTQIPGACPSCGTEGSVALHVVQKYAHFLFIPVFPLRRSAVTVCGHCKHTLEGKELSPSAQMVYQSARSEFKAPVWMWSGLIIIGLLTPVAVWQSNKHDKAVLARLNAPQVGDMYEIKLGTRRYTLYKVEEVSGDSIYVSVFNYETNKHRGLGELLDKEDGEFGPDLIGYSRADVLAMREDRMIQGLRDL